MAIQFKKATRSQSKLRMAIDGPAGSGKTYTALRFAFLLASSADKVAVVDTEAGSASKYVGEAPDGISWAFDTAELPNFNPQNYIDAIHAAEAGEYEVILLDSISHAWEGEGGALQMHDDQVLREPGRNSWTAWRPVTKVQNEFVEAMLQSKCHIIATMRSRTDYIQVTENGKTSIKKVGLAPVQRPGVEYEFDAILTMDIDHNMVVTKTRCSPIDGDVVKKPGAQWFAKVKGWLLEGTPAPEDKAKAEAERPARAHPPKPEPARTIPNGQPMPPPALAINLAAEEPAKGSKQYEALRGLQRYIFGRIKQEAETTTLAVADKEVYAAIKTIWGIDSLHQFPYELVNARQLWEEAIKTWFAAQLAQGVPA